MVFRGGSSPEAGGGLGGVMTPYDGPFGSLHGAPYKYLSFIPGVQGTVPGARIPSPSQEGAFQQCSTGFWGNSKVKTDSF